MLLNDTLSMLLYLAASGVSAATVKTKNKQQKKEKRKFNSKAMVV